VGNYVSDISHHEKIKENTPVAVSWQIGEMLLLHMLHVNLVLLVFNLCPTFLLNTQDQTEESIFTF